MVGRPAKAPSASTRTPFSPSAATTSASSRAASKAKKERRVPPATATKRGATPRGAPALLSEKLPIVVDAALEPDGKRRRSDESHGGVVVEETEKEEDVDNYSRSSSLSAGSVEVVTTPLLSEGTAAIEVPTRVPMETLAEDGEALVVDAPTHQCDSSQHGQSVTCVSDSEETMTGLMSTSSLSPPPPSTSINPGPAHIDAAPCSLPRKEMDEDDTDDDMDYSAAVQHSTVFSRGTAASPATAPILDVSRLTDYFAYGVQAAMQHYAEPSDADASAVDGNTTLEMSRTRYHNAFLIDTLQRNHEEGSPTQSRTSSAATYDSDAENAPANTHNSNNSSNDVEQFLEPHQTSLYLAQASPSFTTSTAAAAAGATASQSWTGMTSPSAGQRHAQGTAKASTLTTVKKPARVPVDAVLASHETSCGAGRHASAFFREALRCAYASEDATRQRRRAEVGKQQDDFIRILQDMKARAAVGAPTAGVRGSPEGDYTASLEPAAPRENRGAAMRSAQQQQQQQKQQQQVVSSSLSALAHFAESIDEEGGRGRGDNSSADEHTPAMGCVPTPSSLTPSVRGRPHLLQVVPPSRLYTLRRGPSAMVDALLRHHQEAQRKQRAAYHAEDQAVHVRRLYELPTLTEDIVRYVALLLCLKRTTRRAARASESASAAAEASPERGTSPTTAESAFLAAGGGVGLGTPAGSGTSSGSDAMPPYGEEGSLLYMKYPAPLLRTTSFAVETVRLLKWLRTWKNNTSSSSSSSGPAGVGASAAQPPGPTSASSPLLSRSTHSGAASRRAKKARTELSDTERGGDVAGCGKAAELTLGPETLSSRVSVNGGRPVHHSTVERAHEQLQQAREASEAQAKKEKKNAFLSFFGAAAAATSAPSAAATSTTKPSVKREDNPVVEVVVVSQEDARDHDPRPVKTSAAVKAEAVKADEKSKGKEEEEVLVQSQQPGAAAAAANAPAAASLAPHHAILTSSPPSLPPATPQFPPAAPHPSSYGYHLYCLAWRQAVKTGITPLATAAQAFAGTRHGSSFTTPTAMECRAGNAAGENGNSCGASRLSAVLQLTMDANKAEVEEEEKGGTQRSVSRGVYYEDAYGNRLRSVRLAQKEQEKREQLAAQQRRREKKKGYFHRDGTEEGAVESAAAAAMLEAVLSPPAEGAMELGARRSRPSAVTKRARAHSISSSSSSGNGGGSSRSSTSSSGSRTSSVHISDSDDSVAGKQQKRKKQPAAKKKKKKQASTRSRKRSSTGDSNDDDDDEGEEGDDADGVRGAKDEITNIAVVSGPTGAGKTAAVYVAAQLLEFRVVEMNASVRRCPKSVEHLLAELTRSHRLSSLRTGSAGFNAEEELSKLKQQHAAMMERAKAEAGAAEREAEQKKKEARKANGISAQAVANFFSAKPTGGKTEKKAKEKASTTQTTNVDEGSENEEPEEKGKRREGEREREREREVAGAAALSPPPPLVPLSPASTAPTQNSAPSAGGVRTLLLFEDADILLGDESAKSFYAAIRDLARRSKVPIVVTVSADPSPTQRYDTPLFPAAEAAGDASTSGGGLRPTYWQLCEQQGLDSPMDRLEAAYTALQASPVLANGSGDNAGGGGGTNNNNSSSAAAGAGGGGGAGGTSSGGGDGGHSGGNSPSSLAANGAGASFASLFSPSNTTLTSPGFSAGSTSAASPLTGAAVTAGLGSGTGGSSSAAAAAAQLASRYTHMLLNASLVSSFFGSQTPFTVVDAMPSTALFAQLLAVGAVELDLFHWQPVPPSSTEEPYSPHSLSGSTSPPSLQSWQQEMDRLTSTLTLRDPARFFQLAALLCTALFGSDDGVGGGGGETRSTAPQGQHEEALTAALRRDAASRSTTDIRYWLNRLQMLLWTLQPADRSSSSSTHPENIDANTTESEANTSRRAAERLVEGEYRQHCSRAASEWDRDLGRYVRVLHHNEQRSSRNEHWLLDDHVDYGADIVAELHSTDHPTLRIDYAAPPAATVSGRKGRPPALATKQTGKQTAAKGKGPAAQPLAANTPPVDAPGGDGRLNSAWKAFFGGPAGSGAGSTVPGSSDGAAHGGMGPPRGSGGGQQTLFGFPRAQASASGAAPAATGGGMGSVAAGFDVPSRYDWPPSLAELRRQAHRDAVQPRPVELLLPYSTAQAYYDTLATTVSSSAWSRVHEVAESSPLMLGHDTPLRFVNRQGGREMIREEGDCCDVSDELPASVCTTQEERFAVFRRWWRRTRKVGALRDSVAGRSAEALEDMLGFGCLLAPPPSAANSKQQ